MSLERPRVELSNCQCDFCICFFQIENPSDGDKELYSLHLQGEHGLLPEIKA